jgi:hypothetical protein
MIQAGTEIQAARRIFPQAKTDSEAVSLYASKVLLDAKIFVGERKLAEKYHRLLRFKKELLEEETEYGSDVNFGQRAS